MGLDRVVVEAKVKGGLSIMPGMEKGAGANGDRVAQVVLVAELLAHALLEVLAVDVNLVKNAVRPDVTSGR